MHQPLSNSLWAPIVCLFTYIDWTQSRAHLLFTFTRQFLESFFSTFLLHHYPVLTSLFAPCALLLRLSSFAFSLATLWTFQISFISTRIILIRTLSSTATADITTAHPLLWIWRLHFFCLNFSIPFFNTNIQHRGSLGWVCTQGFIICIACLA